MKTKMFRVRIEPELKEQLQEAVKQGKAKNMSELIRASLSKFLEDN